MKYALDTNVYVDAFRDGNFGAELLAFLERAAPVIFLGAVVMQELAAGARTPGAASDLRRLLFEPFVRRSRVFTPSAGAFVESGNIAGLLASRQGWRASDNPSLLNDALIACSCRERGITLITRDNDFNRIAPFLRGWRHTRPWPAL